MTRLDIFSDPVCPWCYIGKTLLDRALETRPDHPFAVDWHPFQLNPDMPAGGMDRADYLRAKFGAEARAVQVYARIEQAAQAAGLAIDFGAIRRMPNTLDAHRTILWAGVEGRQGAMVAALFRAYWREGRDIGDPAVLVDLAGQAGLPAAAFARLLATDADRDTIRARDAHARDRGVTAVPTFVLADRYVLAGAQPAELWLRVIGELTGAGAA